MKNLIAINGSPRKNWNTATLLERAMKGAEDAGASTELINLYALNFKGCASCFACKLKTRPHGTCAVKDDLTPVIEKLKAADAIIFGTPIYFMNFSSSMVALIERFFFSNMIYSLEIPTVLPKKIPSAFICTMGMTEENFHQFKVDDRLATYTTFAGRILGVAPKVLCSYDTVQFKDYSRYESSMFDPAAKLAYREKNFPADLATAYDIGRELVTQ